MKSNNETPENGSMQNIYPSILAEVGFNDSDWFKSIVNHVIDCLAIGNDIEQMKASFNSEPCKEVLFHFKDMNCDQESAYRITQIGDGTVDIQIGLTTENFKSVVVDLCGQFLCDPVAEVKSEIEQGAFNQVNFCIHNTDALKSADKVEQQTKE